MQTIYQDKVTQLEQDNLMENILNTLTTLCTKVDSIGFRVQKLEENAEKSKATSQQHDYKHAELRRSADGKQPELKGDVGKLPKTHNIANVLGTSTGAMEKTTSKNTNLNNLFTKPLIPKVQIVDTPIPQTSTYAASLHKENL